ncbi:MAG: hypothetical protein WAV40_01605 [Microgenomates group bacterium]
MTQKPELVINRPQKCYTPYEEDVRTDEGYHLDIQIVTLMAKGQGGIVNCHGLSDHNTTCLALPKKRGSWGKKKSDTCVDKKQCIFWRIAKNQQFKELPKELPTFKYLEENYPGGPWRWACDHQYSTNDAEREQATSWICNWD